jgi:polyhydroxyalkanoate synthesis regulator phasin
MSIFEREPKMKPGQAKRLVAKRLAQKKFPDEVAKELADRGDMSWEQAYEIVEEVQKKNKGAIARRQVVGKFISALIFAAIGLVLMAMNARVLERREYIADVEQLPFHAQLIEISVPYFGRVYGGGNEMVFLFGLLFFAMAGVVVLFAILAALRP